MEKLLGRPLPYRECAMFGDAANDMIPAAALGMQSVLLHDPKGPDPDIRSKMTSVSLTEAAQAKGMDLQIPNGTPTPRLLDRWQDLELAAHDSGVMLTLPVVAERAPVALAS